MCSGEAVRCLESYNSDGRAIQMLDGLIIDTNWYVECVCAGAWSCLCSEDHYDNNHIASFLCEHSFNGRSVVVMGEERFRSGRKSGRNRSKWYGGMPI